MSFSLHTSLRSNAAKRRACGFELAHPTPQRRFIDVHTSTRHYIFCYIDLHGSRSKRYIKSIPEEKIDSLIITFTTDIISDNILTKSGTRRYIIITSPTAISNNGKIEMNMIGVGYSY